MPKSRQEVAALCASYSMHQKPLTNGGVQIAFDMNGESGSMFMYPLFTGVVLAINDFSMHVMPAGTTVKRKGLLINICCEGRCQVDLGGSKIVFVEAGYVSIDTRHARDAFRSPVGRYCGLELFFDFSVLEATFPPFFTDLDIDPFALRERFCPEGRSFVGVLPHGLLELAVETVSKRDVPFSSYRLKLARCLKALEELNEHANVAQKVWLTPTQAKVAQAVEAELSSHLDRHISVASLARAYGVGESSLRSYFHSMFGESVPSYIRRLRMDRAAKLLEDTDETVGRIALQVGYGNQSKFAGAFKAAKSVPPFEYRRLARLKIRTATCGEMRPDCVGEDTQ